MAVKLGLRDRAIISFGDYAGAVSEEEIQKRMQEIASEEMPEKSLVQVYYEKQEEAEKPASKRGRKPTMKGGKTISVWLDDESIELAKKMAGSRNVSLSSFFRSLIRDAATPKIPQPNISTVGRRF